LVYADRVDLPAVVAAVKEGAAQYLVKPPVPDVWLSTIRQLLERVEKPGSSFLPVPDPLASTQALKMEILGRLTAGIIHEINNLLTLVGGYAELLGMGLSPDDPLHSCVQGIAHACRRGTSLTEQILVFCRPQTAQPRIFDLNQVVLQAGKMLRPVLGPNIELAVTVEPEPGFVQAEASQLELALLNLAINARDAMPTGGTLSITTFPLDVPAGSIGPEGLPPGNYAAVAVADTGYGMSEETQARLFEPFFTTKEAGKGTGLGLPTVKATVERMSGRIGVSSQPGQGSRFTIYLPRVSEEASRPPGEQTEPEAARGVETILLIEDEEAVRSLLRQVLERYGYTVYEARDAEEGWAVADQRQGGIDLVVTDLVLPGENGDDFARRLVQRWPRKKVLFISGQVRDLFAERAAPNLPGALLQKPFAPRDLVRVVRKVLDEDTAAATRS
jgi:signal transduction histidine kinase/CheY-like chemotaxis protein